MHSTWIDNEHHIDPANRRIESASKKTNYNRIQVVSKMNPTIDRNQIPLSFQTQNPSQFQYLNQTCIDRSNKIPMKRLNTVDGIVDKDQKDKNLLKLMQQQLELAKSAYQQKIKQQLKQSSIELSKLKIKIQNNTQLIALKDQQIQQLRDQLRRGSPVKQVQQQKTQQTPTFVLQKINDIQIKFIGVIQNQNKLAQKINDLNIKIEAIQKGLLSVLACKIANIQSKLNQFMDSNMQRISNFEQSIINLNKNKKQIMSNSSNSKMPQSPTSLIQFSSNIQSISQRMQNLKQQFLTFKSKQFRYQNSNIINLRNDINLLQNIVLDIERKFKFRNSKLKSSNTSSRKNYDYEKRMNSANNSCYFEDYEQVYDQIDSLGEDQFFHPLQQSARRFHKQPVNVTRFYSNSKPSTTAHNDSFQNFTGDQQQQDTPNQKRLIQALRSGGFKLPLPIEVDLSGYVRKKIDQRYLLDNQKKVFVLNTAQLNQCKEKGWITW